MENLPLKRLVERAYGVRPFQVTGPAWMEDVRFDIAAKYPPDTPSDDRSVMLRTLLEDRFKLSVHHESKDMSGYALAVAKSGFKLKPVEPVEPGEGDTWQNGDGRVTTLKAKQISMAKLADVMARDLGGIVVDKSGMAGVYSFEIRWTIEEQSGTSSDADRAASRFAAIQDALGSLGLRLQGQRVPVQVVVVDHVERVPNEN